MAVIKSHNAASLLKEAIVLDLGDLKRQAEVLRAAANRRAQQIVAAAQQEASRLSAVAHQKAVLEGEEQGMEQGLAEGRKQGRADALAEARPQLQQLEEAWVSAANQWEAQRLVIDRESRQAVLKLAIRLAARIVHRVVEVDPMVIVDQVAAAVAHVSRPLDVTVHICPDDRPTLEEALPRLANQFAQLKHLHLVDDPALSRGGCVVTYGQARIDATLQTQLQRIVELILPGDSQADDEPGTPIAQTEGGTAGKPPSEGQAADEHEPDDADAQD